jgi:hypothetical protein
MPTITIKDLRFSNDAGTLRLDTPAGWQQAAIGINSAINLIAEADGAAFADMPATLPVELTSRSPNRAGGSATLTRLRLDVPKTQDLGTATRYQLSKAWSDLAFKNVDSVREVATVMRKGNDATAADRFHANLHYVGRGFSRQPFFVKDSSGNFALDVDAGDPNQKKEAPPAEFVMLGGGVEILEARVPPESNRKVSAGPARALVRSPADIWFYSGHGLESGELAVGPLDGTHNYLLWKEAADFLAAWVSGGNKSHTTDMRILILNGCNVLNLNPSNGTPGREWAKLLQARSGNLTHILGYAGKAPLDIGGGAEIAAQIGRAIRRGDDPVKAWLDINGNRPFYRWGAVAMDTKGYHKFNDKHKRVTGPLP